jgi:hypothetical protein
MPNDEMYPGMDEESSPSETDNDSETEGETALLSKSIFGDHEPKAGDTCKFKVVRVHEDEVEVEYVKHESAKGEDKSPEDKLAAMGKENPKGGY